MCFPILLQAQRIPKDSLDRLLHEAPTFTIYKENYFITGVPLNEKPTKYNSDAKFQISFKQRLTKTVLPFDTYLYMMYTQKAFWDIYRKSSPFGDLNFNPGIGLGKFLFRDNMHIGLLSLSAEHESNGKDGVNSRSWNYLAVNYLMLFKNSRLLMKAWLPLGSSNSDLFKYIGYGEMNFFCERENHRVLFNIIARKGASWDWKGSIQAGLFFKPFKFSNQYWYLQFFQGYAENLLYYNRYTCKIRLGIAIVPSRQIID